MQMSKVVKDNIYNLRLIFWETTSKCNLKCIHCRAGNSKDCSDKSLNIKQCYALLDDIASFASPIIVLSGGEPLMRKDICKIASYGNSLGLKMVLATNGTLLTTSSANKIVKSGIQRISVSIDGADADTHDSFRHINGAFQSAINGIKAAQNAGMQVQINTTVTRHNINQLEQIYEFALSIGACALHLFLLVPTGCGKEIANTEMISPNDYEQVLLWIFDKAKQSKIKIKPTCAPHYFRIISQQKKADGVKIPYNSQGLEAATKGCLAGSSVCFVSYKGDVFPCGYFPVSAGNICNSSLKEIWGSSELFYKLRDASALKGKCGICEYSKICGGCRARAYAETGDYLSEEPYCTYLPSKLEM